jgi:hypothetical protein
MPPLYRLTPVQGKQPPAVLPRGLISMFNPDDEGWPCCLCIPVGAGLFDLCGLWHGTTSANKVRFDGADTEASPPSCNA